MNTVGVLMRIAIDSMSSHIANLDLNIALFYFPFVSLF